MQSLFTVEISDSEIISLNTKVYESERFNRESTLHVQTHYKETKTSEYLNFYSCHLSDAKKGFVKGKRNGFYE